LEQAGAETDRERVQGTDSDEREDRPERAGVGAVAQAADQVRDGWDQNGGGGHDGVTAAWDEGRGERFEDRGGDVAADRADDHEHEDPQADLIPGCERADLAYHQLRALFRGDRSGKRLRCGGN
jgi:hypothetical protein